MSISKYEGLSKQEEEILLSYLGRLKIVYNGKTLVEVEDTRVLEFEKLIRKRNLWIHYNSLILDAVPEHKQRNMSLGLISEDKIDEYKTLIQAYRQAYSEQVSALEACITLADLDKLELQ